MSKETIVAKALRCIDEIYPEENTLNEGYFPTDAFINEMVRWVIDIAPTHKLSKRKDLELGSDEVESGIGRGFVPDDFGRLVYFKAYDWKRPVFGVISEDDPRYVQQYNKVLRGNPSRPIVTIGYNLGDNIRKVLRWYTTDEADYEGQYVPYSIDYIPDNLEDLAAWKLAETVLMSMSDAQAAAVCTAKVNEHLEMLAL